MAPKNVAISDSKHRSTDYVFTAYCENEPVHGDGVTYLVFQREAGNETHREHWQGYVEFQHAKSFKAAQKCLNIGAAHMEKRWGSRTQAADYCMKEDTRLPGCEPKEFGERKEDSQQGERNDLKQVADMILNKKRVREVANEFPCEYIKFHRGIEKLRAFQIEPRNSPCEVTVLVGPTGVGKSRKARELLKDNPYIWGPEQKQWFDGYDGEDECIFEEFRGQLPFGMILRILDRYDCRVEVKGGCTQFRATKIVITSPVKPEEWYANMGNDKIDQLLRRINSITQL
ncbi:MAG: putative viral replication protein [Circoviridae sp.]|nr:MAG: putative viral replication protein [Circoviridae sp.]